MASASRGRVHGNDPSGPVGGREHDRTFRTAAVLDEPVVVVAAHPDDETIGAGALLGRLRDLLVVHVTEGAPRDRALIPERYRDHPRAYAECRRREALSALALAGVAPERVIAWDFVDQEVVTSLVPITRRLATLLRERRPELVITHPYEGGHPDHDGTAFAVHAAVELVARGGPRPRIVEMSSYFGRGGKWVTGSFLPGDPLVWDRALTSPEVARKRSMLAAYASQSDVLAMFGTAHEPLRPAPRYDFGEPPHSGPVLYECMGWTLTAERFCELALAARRELGLERAE